ncbi:hypothetical protein G6F56_014677 [Rhizopus delemar]|nr:hypothetical protein G6F56_014677 [Rhizopus delemar]
MISSFEKIVSQSSSVRLSIVSPWMTIELYSSSETSSIVRCVRFATISRVSPTIRLILRPIASAVSG